MRRTRNGGPVLGEPRKRRVGGFTLIEMLVVVLIIGLLMTIGVVGYNSMIERARYANADAWVKVLSGACENYKIDHRAFPPSTPYEGSKNLHYYLGRTRMVVIQHGADGIMERRPALVAFTLDRLVGAKSTEPNPPCFVKDIWDRKIEFASPGAHNKKGFDIRSLGADDKDATDDITNWTGE